MRSQVAVRGQLLVEEYRQGLAAMNALHEGESIEAAARSVLAQLPSGPHSLVATSVEGAALAAVCCVLASGSDLTWEYISLQRPAPEFGRRRVVAVEPMDPGLWWRQALAYRLPHASVVIASPLAPAHSTSKAAERATDGS